MNIKQINDSENDSLDGYRDKKGIYELIKSEEESLSLYDLINEVEDISEPLAYYGKGAQIEFLYVSDIHLPQHTWKKYDIDNPDYKKAMDNARATGVFISNPSIRADVIDEMVKKLYASAEKFFRSTIIFDGDIADSPLDVLAFLDRFNEYVDELRFKRFIFKLNQLSEAIEKLNKLKGEIENKKKEISTTLDIGNDKSFLRYKNKFFLNDSVYKALESYSKNSKRFVNNEEFKKAVRVYILSLKEYDDLFKECKRILYFVYKCCGLDIVDQINDLDCIRNIKESDYIHVRLVDYSNIIFILGNHEFTAFSTIKECVEYYKKELNSRGIKLLFNDVVQIGEYQKLYWG